MCPKQNTWSRNSKLLSPHSILDNLSVNSFQRTEKKTVIETIWKKARKKERKKGEKFLAPDEIWTHDPLQVLDLSDVQLLRY